MTDAVRSRVLIVDDHPILRHGIAQMVAREEDMLVSGEAGSVPEALAFIATHPVDLAIVDLSLDDRSGMELLRTVHQRHPHVRCLVLSMHDENLHAERALRAGASGYVMKQEATRKIITALRRVRDGHIYLSDALGSQFLQRIAGAPASPASASVPSLGALSDRELEVLRLIGKGMKTGDIARTLNRSVHTIETHRANIKRKLALRSAGELAQYAFGSDA
ncbi:MAG: response regulator transcription factor [Variovorax sp.]